MKKNNYQNDVQSKNLCWMLPRPKPDKYKGGMPLYAEDWCIQLAKDLLNNQSASVLNIFCGMNKYGFRVDIKDDVHPDLVCDVHELSKYINQKFDIIFADPPYSNDEAKEIYGTPKLKYKVWTQEADKCLNSGGLLVIYHKHLMPNPDPQKYKVEKRVTILNRVLHPPRVAVYFRKD